MYHQTKLNRKSIGLFGGNNRKSCFDYCSEDTVEIVILIIQALIVTLTVEIATKMTHWHSVLGYKMLSGSEDVIWTKPRQTEHSSICVMGMSGWV